MLNNATESKEKKNRTSLSGMENKALLLSCLQTSKLYWQVFGGLLTCLLLFFLVMLLQNILYKICVMRDYFAWHFQVVMAANSYPALNDVMFSELVILTESVADLCPEIRYAWLLFSVIDKWETDTDSGIDLSSSPSSSFHHYRRHSQHHQRRHPLIIFHCTLFEYQCLKCERTDWTNYIFTSPTKDSTVILRDHSRHAKV